MTNKTNQSFSSVVDAVICVGLPYMNIDWAKFEHEQHHMLEAFRATRGYTDAKQAILQAVEQLCNEVIGDSDTAMLIRPITPFQNDEDEHHQYERAYYRDALRAQQRQRLAELLKGETV